MIQTSREALHRLVEELPEAELRTAGRFLEFLRDRGGDPVGWALDHAPEDDPTPDEIEALAEADADQAAGSRTYSVKEVRRDLEI
jgi:hypothetical protein